MARRVLTRVGQALGLLVVFVAAALLALLLHVDSAAERRIVARLVPALLGSQLGGSFSLASIERIDRNGAVFLGFSARDPKGREVIRAKRVRAQADLIELASALVFGPRRLSIVIEHVQITQADVFLFDDEGHGVPSIAATFLPRGPGTGKGRPVRLAIRAIEIDRAHGQGKLASLPFLNADIATVNGWLRVAERGVELSFSRFSTRVTGLPRADADGISSLRLNEPGFLRASFDGHYGPIQVSGTLRRDDDRLSLTVEVPKAAPDQIRSLISSYPLVDDITLSAELAGSPPYLIGTTQVQVGQGQIVGRGSVSLADPGHAELEFVGRRVNVESVIPGSPPTALDLATNLTIDLPATGPVLSLDAEVEPSLLGEFTLPPLWLTGRYADGRFEGRALLEEPGMPLRVAGEIKSSGVIDLTAKAKNFELARVPRIRRAVELSGRTSLDAKLHFEPGRAAGELVLDVSGFRYGQIGLGRASVNAKAHGSLEDWRTLNLDLGLEASRVDLGELALTRLSGKATGPLSAPNVRVAADDAKGGKIAAEGRLKLERNGARLEAAKVRAERGGQIAIGAAQVVSVAGERIEVREVSLSVLGGKGRPGEPDGGTIRGSFVLDRHFLEMDARAEALDLATARALLGVSPTRLDGKLTLDSEIVIARDLQRGRLVARLDDASYGKLEGMTLSANGRLDGSALTLDGGAQIENLGELRGHVQAELHGNPLVPDTLRTLTGEASLQVVRVDLARARPLLGDSVPPLEGLVGAELKLRRSESDQTPSVSLLGYTEGFGIDFPGADEPISLRGVDLRFGANVEGGTGEADANVKLVDHEDALASLTVQSAVDLADLIQNPALALAKLEALPITGKLRMEPRDLDSLPEPIRPSGVSGKVRLEANLAGTLGGPDLFARASLEGLELTDVRGGSPLDVCTSLAFDDGEQRFAGSGEIFLSQPSGVCSGRRLSRYAIDGRLVPDPGSRFGQVEGTLVAELERLPIEVLPVLGDQGFSGLASGTLSIARSGGIPVVFARFTLHRARVQGVPVGDGTLDIRSNDRAIAATLKLARDQSRLEATALALLDTTQILPSIDEREPIGARIAAHGVDAVVLLPLTRDLFSELGGRLDGELDILLSPPPEDGSEAQPGRVSGRATLHDGSLQLAGLGLRLNAVEVNARAEPLGKQTLISIATLEGSAGKRGERVRVRDGRVWLDGVRLSRAQGTIEATELPLLLEGVSQATATTRQGVGFELTRTPENMHVAFDVPYLSVVLPQSSVRGVISLDENRSIEVIQPLGEPKRRGGDGLPWLLDFKLGRNVQITRSDLDLPLSGNVQVLLAEKAQVTGDLDLASGGRIQVSGKTFVIDSGEAHFDTGEATNPRLHVVATWRAPDGTIVIADVSGTFKQARLRLSSDPPRSEQEIYALLLGGSGTGGEGGDPAATGAGVGADLLGSLLVNTPLRQVEFRAGSEQLTDQRSYSTYTAAVPISDEVWFEGSYKSLNTANPNEERDAFSGTIDWRFRRNWSLRTEVGTIGTGLDLVWQYRY